MKKSFGLLCAGVILVAAPVFAGSNDRSGFVFIFDAGVPLKGAEGRYGADFGRAFLDLGAQVRIAGNFYLENTVAFFPAPRRGDPYFYNSDGFEITVDGLWKLAPRKKLNPFVKIGVSYAWISSNNAYTEIFYPDAGRQIDRWLGLNAGGGIEFRLNQKLVLRLGGVFTLVPNDGEGAVASWGKLFAGIGLRI
jgi:hypothetical protein